MVISGQDKKPGVQYEFADVSQPDGRQHLGRLLELAADCLARDGQVLVHCMAGRHRTGAFCAVLAVIKV